MSDRDRNDCDHLDGYVEGDDGANTIDSSYTGDRDGDRIDANDAILPGEQSNDDIVLAGGGDDIVKSGSGDDEVYGGDDNDMIFAASGDDVVYGGSGDDKVEASSGEDVVFGGDGDDDIWAGKDNDTVSAGAGNDTVVGGDGEDLIAGGSGNDTIDAGSENDEVYGGGGADSIEGGTGNDTLIGGNTEFDGTLDFDDLSTGELVDGQFVANGVTITSSDPEHPVMVFDTNNPTGGDNDLATNNLNNVLILSEDRDSSDPDDNASGGTFNIVFDGPATVTSLTILDADHGAWVKYYDVNGNLLQQIDVHTANNGQEVISTNLTNVGSIEVILGASGAIDNLTYSIDADDLDGNDTIDGEEGDDYIEGNAGNDSLDGGEGNDEIFGGTGDDRIFGNDGNDTQFGGEGNDVLGGADFGDDTYFGGAGDDMVEASFGDDLIFGGEGNDDLWASSDNDEVFGGDGDDNVYGGQGTDTVSGDDGNDTLSGGSGADTVFGGAGDDVIDGDLLYKDDNGAAGNDQLFGGDDADTIIANAGDTVDGGAGGNDHDILDLTGEGPFFLAGPDGTGSPVADSNGNGLDGTVIFVDEDGEPTGETLSFTEIEQIIGDEVNRGPEAGNDTASTDEDTPVTISVLDNDSDPDGDTLTITEASVSADQGTVEIVNGELVFTPAENFNGEATITYTVSDGNGGEDTATVTVDVAPVNDAPDAVDDADTTDEDTPITVDLLANDTDVDGDDLTVVSASVPASQGSLVDNGDGTVTFTPAPNFNGEATITYTIEDEDGLQDTATHVITVEPVNDDPIACPDHYFVNEDETTGDLDGNVITNPSDNGAGLDIDPDGDTLTVVAIDGDDTAVGTVVTGSNGGEFVLNADGSFDFSANGDFEELGVGETADTQITYTVSDGNGGEATTTLTITINGQNDGPVATDNDYVESADDSATDIDGNILRDDTGDGADFDVDGDLIRVVSITNGTDTDAPNDPFGNTGSPATVAGDNGGIITIYNGGNVQFDPNGEFDDLAEGETATTSVTYTIEDENGAQDTAVVTFTVTGTNDAPVAVLDTDTTDEDTAITLDNVLGNDEDIDGDTLTVSEVNGDPANVGEPIAGDNGGLITINEDGTASFDPNGEFEALGDGETAETEVTYTVTDPSGATSTTTVTVTVTGVNDAPNAVDSSYVVAQDEAAGDVDANALTDDTGEGVDSDPEGDDLTVVAVEGDTGNVGGVVAGDNGGLFTINADGSVDFDANDEFDGLGEGETATTTVSYTIADEDGLEDTATVTFTVTGTNDGPVAVEDTDETDQDTAIVLDNVLGNDSDPDGDTLTVASVDGDAANVGTPIAGDNGGLITINADGTASFDPNGDFDDLGTGDTEETAVTYTITDGNGGTDTTTVTVTVTGTNDAPEATNSSYVVAQDEAFGDEDANAITDDTGDGVDSDVDGDPLTVAAVDGAAANVGQPVAGDNGGLFTIAEDGTVDFSANGEFDDLGEGETASTTVTYTITDPEGGTDTATVTFTVTGTNDGPVAVEDTDATDQDTAIVLDNVLGNDSDPDGDTLTVASVDGDAANVGTPIAGDNGGLITINADGTASFDPNGDFDDLGTGDTEETAVTYTITDGNGGTDTTTVTVTVTGTNDAPEATNSSYVVAQDEAFGDVDANAITDDTGDGVDSDVDGDPLTVAAVDGAAANVGQPVAGDNGGLFTIAEDGTVDFSANGEFDDLGEGETASTTVTYTITDPEGGTDTATVTFTVTGTNDGPVAVEDTFTTDEDTVSELGNVLDNDSDPDSDPLTVAEVNGDPANVGQPVAGSEGGLVTINPDGTISFDPNGEFDELSPGESVETTVTYTVTDPSGAEATETVTITVNGVNDGPEATDNAYVVSLTETAGDVDGNVITEDTGDGVDSDPEDDDLTVVAVDGDAANVGNVVAGDNGGTFTINDDGTVDFDAGDDFDDLGLGETRDTSVTYTIADENGATDTATATFTVTGINDGTVQGTAGNDVINPDIPYVDADGDIVDAGDGILPGDEDTDNDVIEGFGGDDSIDAGAGDDVVFGGADDDTIDGNIGDDELFGGQGDDDIEGGEGDDVVDGGAGDDVLNGGDGDDTVVGGAGNDTIDGNDGDDELRGGSGDDVINGSEGEDTLFGGTDADGIDLGGDDVLFGGADDDTVIGGAGEDIVSGDEGNDELHGGLGDDTLLGGDGNDVIEDVEGNDSVEGGDGNDIINVGSTQGDENPDVGYPEQPSATVPDLVFPGYDADEDPNDDKDFVDGGAGDDIINTGDDDDTIIGGSGNDTINAGFDDDTVDGGTGDDFIEGGEGNDTVEGGDGDDTIFGGIDDPLADAVSFPDDEPDALGFQDLVPENNGDVLFGGAGNDTIFGQDDDDSLFGGDGDDVLDGGIDDDMIQGGDGNDVVIGGQGDDSLTGNDGNDTVVGGDGADIVRGGTGDDDLTGDDGMDMLFGGAGNDTIDGGDDDDKIEGGSGDDTIIGGAGNDDLWGASGDDSVDGGTGDDVINTAEGNDVVEGGDGDDVIDTANDETPEIVVLPDGILLTGENLPDVGYPGAYEADADPFDDLDTVFGGAGNDSITTGDDDDTIFGGTGDDNIDAGIDDDFVEGGEGNDTILGSEGNDEIYGEDGDDVIYGGLAPGDGDFADLPNDLDGDGDSNDPGEDLVTDNNNDTLFGGAGNDFITGNDDDDTLYGGTGNDVLDGGIDDDTIYGDEGEDTIIGGQGTDELFGGLGSDTFLGGDGGDVVVGGEDPDDTDVDVLDLTGSGVDFITYVDGDPEAGEVTFLDGSTMTFSEIENVIPCFTPGTTIATPKGERLVEELREGDRIITRDNGIQEIRWVGRKEMSGKALVANSHLKPILIRAGALGNGLPERDMLVSPNHRCLVASEKTQLYFEEREVLAAAKHLVGSEGIHAVDVMGTSYIHFMFDRHEVVLSNGAWTESFQPGDYSLKGIGNAQRNEIFELFPELQERQGLEGYQSARRALKKHEAKLLIK